MDPTRYPGTLLDAVDEGLGTLGRLPKLTIYAGLEDVFKLRKADIPKRFDEFSKILREMLGTNAEPILEFIMERFYDELGVESKQGAKLDESIARICTMLRISRPLQGKNVCFHNNDPLNSAVARIHRFGRLLYYVPI